MKEDRIGFILPMVDPKRCIHCGMCEKACPVLNFDPKVAPEKKAAVYAAKNVNEEVAFKSSSGGIFSIIAEEILKNDGIVYGVEMTPALTARHTRIENVSDIERIRGSKYLQSNASEVYPSVQTDLRSGKHVLFSGTPCQIAGLKQYLRRAYEKLLCIEVVCHGVPTNLAFRRYLDELEGKHGSKAINVNFRDKSKSWHEYYITFTFDNRHRLKRRCTEDPYLAGYINNLFVRESCTDCKFKGKHSKADIILGDMWGIESLIPSYTIGNGVSMICINSATGNETFKQIYHCLSDCAKVDYADVEKHNPCISKSVTAHVHRQSVVEQLLTGPFTATVKKALGVNFRSMLWKRCKDVKIKLIDSLITLKNFRYKS